MDNSVALAILIPMTVAIGIGLWMGWRYLQGQRNRPGLVATHFLLATAPLEAMAAMMRGAPNGVLAAARDTLSWSAALTAAALLSGLFTAIIAKSHPHIIGMSLALHAGIGSLGFMALVWWGIRIAA